MSALSIGAAVIGATSSPTRTTPATQGAMRFDIPTTPGHSATTTTAPAQGATGPGLLMLQAGAQAPARRRGNAAFNDVADQAIDGLRALQQAMLGGDSRGIAEALEASAEALSSCVEEAPLRRSILLRIEIERAKREHHDRAGFV